MKAIICTLKLSAIDIPIYLTNHVQSTNKIIETPHLQVPGLIYLSLNKQISSTKKQIEELKKIENGNTSEDLETIARNRLNMVKPNEIVYIDIGKEGK